MKGKDEILCRKLKKTVLLNEERDDPYCSKILFRTSNQVVWDDQGL